MLRMKAAVLQAPCRGCRCLAHALALPVLASISLVTRSLAYVVPVTKQHEPSQAPLQDPLEPSTHVATLSSPNHLPSVDSSLDLQSSMTPSSPASPMSALVGQPFQQNVPSSAPSVEAPCFQHQLPGDLTPAQQQCIVDLLNAQQLHYEARLTDELCQQAAQREVHEDEVKYLQQLVAQEQQWGQDDLAHAHELMEGNLQLQDMQLADQRQQIADQRQHYKAKVRAERRQAARQQQLHAAELSALHQQLADQHQQFQEHVTDARRQLADQQHQYDQELTDVCQQLVDDYAEQLAEALDHHCQQHANELNRLRQHAQHLLASLQAERQQRAAAQQGYSQAMEALAYERECRERDQAQCTAQVQQLADKLLLSQNMVTQRQALLQSFCFGPTGYHQLQADLTAAMQENAELRQHNALLTQSNELLTQQAQAIRNLQHPVYRANVSSSFMTCILPCLPT